MSHPHDTNANESRGVITHSEARRLAQMFYQATQRGNRATVDKTDRLLHLYLDQFPMSARAALIDDLLEAVFNFTNAETVEQMSR